MRLPCVLEVDHFKYSFMNDTRNVLWLSSYVKYIHLELSRQARQYLVKGKVWTVLDLQLYLINKKLNSICGVTLFTLNNFSVVLDILVW